MQKDAIAICAAGKSEHLLDDVGAALGARFDDVENLSRSAGSISPRRTGSGHHDGDQNVVEIVGHAAGESADALEALRAEELFLDLFLLGDVGVDDELGFRLAMLVADEGPTAADDNGVALFGEVTAFARPDAGLEKGALRGEDIGWLFLIEEIPAQPPARLLGGPAVEDFGAVIPKLDAIIHVAHCDGVVGEVEQIGLLHQFPLGLQEAGQVSEGSRRS